MLSTHDGYVKITTLSNDIILILNDTLNQEKM